MNANAVFMWTGCVVALCLYVPLLRGIIRGEVEQSFATWLLWVTLDLIALTSIIDQKGNFIFLMFYIAGGTTVVISLIIKKKLSWTKFETLILFLVFVCLVVWHLSGSKWATVSSTLAVVISGMPQLRDSWNKPDKMIGIIYAGYVIANGLFMFAGKDWSIEERFYPGSCVVLCVAIAIAALRKEKKRQN